MLKLRKFATLYNNDPLESTLFNTDTRESFNNLPILSKDSDYPRVDVQISVSYFDIEIDVPGDYASNILTD